MRSDKDMIPFQVFGLVFHLYVVYCARAILTLLQIISLVIKNAGCFWNLKFGLKFEQCKSILSGRYSREQA
jgi:hypothetical protein